MLLSRAADSICDGDLVDRQIRSKQNWNLLPTQVSVQRSFYVLYGMGVQYRRLILHNQGFSVILRLMLMLHVVFFCSAGE